MAILTITIDTANNPAFKSDPLTEIEWILRQVIHGIAQWESLSAEMGGDLYDSKGSIVGEVAVEEDEGSY